MATYQPGDICWAVVDELGAVLVTSVGDTTPLGDGRTLEVYDGCSFQPGLAPSSIERFAIVVGSRSVRSSSSPNAGI
jgi:hypothetical protein